MVINLTPRLFLFDHLALRQDPQMFGDRLTCSVKMLSKCIWGHSLQGYQADDSPPGGVGNSLEYISSHVGLTTL